MKPRYCVSIGLVQETFDHLRRCGDGQRECQVLWLSPWHAPYVITEVIHSKHTASSVGFHVDEAWLTWLWMRLARSKTGVRVQVHTHPGHAFHSHIDDHWPLIHTAGFLSLVVPNFATGPVGFDGAHLVEVAADGRWQRVRVTEKLETVP